MPTHDFLVNVETMGFHTPGHRQATRIRHLSREPSPTVDMMFGDDTDKTVAISKEVILKLLAYPAAKIVQFFDRDNIKAEFIPAHQWKATATHGIIVRSLHYKNSVLLHTKTLSRCRTRDSPFDQVRLRTAQWEDATDFEGHVVPLWVMSRMRAVQGGDTVWEGRGIQVGKKAWQVLLDWKKATYPDNVTEGDAGQANVEPDAEDLDGVMDSAPEDDEDESDFEEDSDED
jgi:hypothetical protein